MASYEGTRIVTVGMLSGGYILTGQRRDNGKWTSPGGHADDGEDIMTAALREVREESGIAMSLDQLEFIQVKKIDKGRGGYPFVVFCFLGHVDREKATSKNDPDKEVSVWKWVPLDKATPELLAENRHAFQDDILVHLGINAPKEANLSRKMSDVSKDIQNANLDDDKKKDTKSAPGGKTDPNAPAPLPEPKPKTPADMQTPPDAYLPDDEVTGD